MSTQLTTELTTEVPMSAELNRDSGQVTLGAVATATLSAELLRAGWRGLVLRWLAPALVTGLGGALMVWFVVRASLDGATPLEAPADIVLIGFTMVGFVILLISAAWSYLGEQSSGVLSDLYRFVPNRLLAAGCKLLAVVVLAFAVTLLTEVVSLGSYALLDDTERGHRIGALLGDPIFLLGLPLFTSLACLGSLAFAMIVRNTPVVLGLIVVWVAIGESLMAQLPVVGPVLAMFAPVANGMFAAGLSPDGLLTESRGLTWLYLVALTAMMTSIALLLERRRDVRQ